MTEKSPYKIENDGDGGVWTCWSQPQSPWPSWEAGNQPVVWLLQLNQKLPNPASKGNPLMFTNLVTITPEAREPSLYIVVRCWCSPHVHAHLHLHLHRIFSTGYIHLQASNLQPLKPWSVILIGSLINKSRALAKSPVMTTLQGSSCHQAPNQGSVVLPPFCPSSSRVDSAFVYLLLPGWFTCIHTPIGPSCMLWSIPYRDSIF